MKIIEKKEHPGLATLYLARFAGRDRAAEFVDTLEPGIPKAEKWVMMISTQVGCPVGCRMCDAGMLGTFGNLSAAEMLAQVRHVVASNPELKLAEHPKVKIHFARMGEPSLNPGVLKALRLLAREYPHAGIMPSLSTVAPKSPAVAPFFRQLALVKDRFFGGGRFQLQFSLHSTDERARRRLVPIKTWTLEEVARYGESFVRPGDRKITLNFALASGQILEPGELRRLFSPEKFLVKITPVNPTRAADQNGTTCVWSRAPAPISAAARLLRCAGFSVILSPSLPEEISAATSCGQLWSQSLTERAATSLRNRKREQACYLSQARLAEKSRRWQEKLAAWRRRDLALDPAQAGLVVIDTQEFFLDRRSPAYRPQAWAILGNVRRLVEAFRGAGRPVFFILHAHRASGQGRNLMTLWWKKVCPDGSRWARSPAALGARKAEIFKKSRYSAFSNAAFGRKLRQKGVGELVVAGIMTNLCVESTVRDAFDSGLKTWTVLDATAAHTEELHVASLKSLAHGFTSLAATDDILTILAAASRGGRRPR